MVASRDTVLDAQRYEGHGCQVISLSHAHSDSSPPRRDTTYGPAGALSQARPSTLLSLASLSEAVSRSGTHTKVGLGTPSLITLPNARLFSRSFPPSPPQLR